MSLNFIKVIECIEFGILSAEEIREMSVVEIRSPKISGDSLENTIYDERMGSIDHQKLCPTCGQDSRGCPGHFGHIELTVPVIHPLLLKFVLQILRIFCPNCSRLSLTEDFISLRGLKKYTQNLRFSRLIKLAEKGKICMHCLTKQAKISFSPTETSFSMSRFDASSKDEKIPLTPDEIFKRFDNILDEDVVLLGFDPKKMHPRNLIITVLPVLPPVDRPFVLADGMTCDDDLTIQYVEITKINNHLNNPRTQLNKRQKYVQSLKFRVKCLFDNSQNKAKHTNGRPFKGIKKRISGKEGQVRGNLMGKRVEQAARTVIGPDPTLKTGQLAIPPRVAEILTASDNVNSHNIDSLQDLVDKGKCNVVIRGESRINLKYATRILGTRVKRGDVIIREQSESKECRKIKILDESFVVEKGDILVRGDEKTEVKLPGKKRFCLRIGDTVERQLKNGDIVLLNRQPTLHKGSMIAHEIIIRKGKTFRMNLGITSTFNADFDGDEMNIHAPQSEEARAELRLLSHAKNLLVSAQASKCNIKIVQDSLLASFLMTRTSNIIVDKPRFWNVCCSCEDWSSEYILKKIRHIQRIFTKHNKGSVYTGRGLFSMVLPEDFNYRKRNNASPKEPEVIIRRGVLLAGAINKSDLGGGHKSILRIIVKEYPVDVAVSVIDNIQFITNAWLVYRGFSVGIKDCIATKQEEIDACISKCFLEATLAEETSRNPLVKEAKINEALSKARDIGMRLAKEALGFDNSFVSTVTSGSKGDFFNIAQIAGLMGQQNFSGSRIKPALNKGRRPLVHYPFEKLSQELEYESKGFVKNSFIRGLTPEECWFHAITGREGVTDTSMKTSKTGYIQRKLIKVSEDLTVAYDGSVRSVNGNVVQFLYGEDGLDGSETIVRNGEPAICDIGRLVEQLNQKAEVDFRISRIWSLMAKKLLTSSCLSDFDESSDFDETSDSYSSEDSSRVSESISSSAHSFSERSSEGESYSDTPSQTSEFSTENSQSNSESQSDTSQKSGEETSEGSFQSEENCLESSFSGEEWVE